jgi:hypothetical protein
MVVHCIKILQHIVGKVQDFLEHLVLKGQSHRSYSKSIYNLVNLKLDLWYHGDRGH